MICNKCGGAIPDESKFCPQCGAMQAEPKKDMFCMECGLMLEQGTMFCPVCGTPVKDAKPSAQAIPAAQAAAPTASGGMETVSAVSRSVPQPVPPPVHETKPSDAVFGAFDAAYGAAEPKPKPSDIAFAKPSDAAFGAPAGGVSLEKPNGAAEPKPSDIAFAKPSDAAFGAPAGEVSYGNPEEAKAFVPAQSSAPLEQTALNKKKGKKWVGPAIGAAAAAVVVGGGALVYNFNKSDVTNLIMGDSAYAKMLEQGFINTFASNSDSTAIAGAAENVMAMAVSSNLSGTDVSELEEIAEDAISGDFGAIAQSSENSGKTTINLRAGIEQLYSQMLELTGYSGAEVKISVEAKMTETLRSLISGGDSDTNAVIDEALDMVNSAELQFSAFSAKDSVSVYTGLNDSSAEFSFGISGVMYADGTVGIMFPKTSDAAIKYTIESDGSVTVEQTDMPSIDEKEIERLKNEIIDLYLSYYEKGKVTVSNADGVKTVTVKISSEQITEMVQQAAELIAEDEYFSKTIVDYINANGGSLTIEEYKSAIAEYASDIEPDESAALVITTKVNKQNNVLAKKIAAVNTDNDTSVEFGYSIKDKNTEFKFAVNDKTSQELTVLVEADNDTDGVITVSFDEYKDEQDENEEEFVLEIKYKDCKQEKFGKIKMLTGSYQASMKKAVSLDTSDEYNESAAILAALQTTKVIYDSKLDGDNVLNQKLTVEVPQYGSIALKITETLTNDAPEKLPDSALNLNKYISEDITGDDIKEITGTIEKLRDDITAQCSNAKSKFADLLSQGANELLNSLLDELTPKADEDKINEVNARADELNDKCYAYSYSYSEFLDDELTAKLNDIMERINGTYLWGEVPLDDYIKAVSEQKAIEEAIAELDEELEKAVKKGVEKLYNDMNVDELEAAKYTLDYMYDYILDEYGTQIKADPELTEAFKEVTEKKGDLDSAYTDMEDMIDGGNIQIATIRTFRKAAAAFDISMSSFLNLFNSKIYN